MTCVQLFMQQVCLESWDRDAWRLSQDFPCLKEMKITIRHSDWWYWEHGARLELDPGAEDFVEAPPEDSESESGSLAENREWGHSFHHFQGLERFVLELETRFGKKNELDEIVRRARDWKFPLGVGVFLVPNHAMTRRTGWVGWKMRRCHFSFWYFDTSKTG